MYSKHDMVNISECITSMGSAGKTIPKEMENAKSRGSSTALYMFVYVLP